MKQGLGREKVMFHIWLVGIVDGKKRNRKEESEFFVENHCAHTAHWSRTPRTLSSRRPACTDTARHRSHAVTTRGLLEQGNTYTTIPVDDYQPFTHMYSVRAMIVLAA